MREMSDTELGLIARAGEAAGRAYCPYSRFPVGAAVETEHGIFTGCNVENASFSLGVCAERVAIHSAIAAGVRNISRLAISCVGADGTVGLAGHMPCGACRQVMAEFMSPDAEVLVDGAGIWRVDELIPHAFRLGAAARKTPDLSKTLTI